MASGPGKQRSPASLPGNMRTPRTGAAPHTVQMSALPITVEPGCGHVVMEQEVTVTVPLVRPKPMFLTLLKSAGAKGEVFTKKEICFYLKDYIASRKLYDVHDPRVVYCRDDPLGAVFEVDKFTINDVLDLLVKHCTPVPDTCIKRKRRLVPWSQVADARSQSISPRSQATAARSQPTATWSHPRSTVTVSQTSHPTSEDGIKTKKMDEDVIDSTSGKTCKMASTPVPEIRAKKRKRDLKKRKHTTSSSSSTSHGRTARRHSTSISVTYSDSETGAYPWYFQVQLHPSDDSEILSVQDKETVLVKDSTDDLWFVEEDSISMEYQSDAFSVEYELESSSSCRPESQSDDPSEMSGEGVLLVCGDSDVEFWADSSAADSESDRELPEADKWVCPECEERNAAYQRYCNRCWKMRSGWLPEKLSKLDKKCDVPTEESEIVDNPVCPPASNVIHKDITHSDESRNDDVYHVFPQLSKKRRKLADDKLSPLSTSCHPHPVEECHLSETQDDSGISVMLSSVPSSLDLHLSPASHRVGGLPVSSDHRPASIHSDLLDMYMDEVDGDVPNLAAVSAAPSTAVSSTIPSTAVHRSNDSIYPNPKLEKLFVRSTETSICSEKSAKNWRSHHLLERGSNSNPSESLPSSRDRMVKSCAADESKESSSLEDSPDRPSQQHRRLPVETGARCVVALDSDLCVLCLTKPKTGSIIHGNSGHQVCCYKCAKRLKSRGKPCPVCRRPIQKVVRNYVL